MLDTTDNVVKRLHISGLTPSITPSHIKDRFNSFGKVQDVEQLQPDALGTPRTFTYMTIETTPQQLKKCLNIMSGSTWRGTQLRLAEAKPRYQDRLESARNPPVEIVQLKLRQKRRRLEKSRAEDVGKEAQDMRLVTEQNFLVKPHWIKESDHLIRPVCIRPSHPISPSIIPQKRALPPTVTKNTTQSKSKKAESKPRTDRPRPAISRMPRKLLNPLNWAPTHLTSTSFSSALPEDGSGVIGEVSWEPVGEEDGYERDALGREVIGIWRRVVEGEVVEEELVHGSMKRVEGDEEEEMAVEEYDGEGSPLFAGLEMRSEGEREDSPLFPVRSGGELEAHDEASPPLDDVLSNQEEERGLSPLFPVRSVSSKENTPEPVESMISGRNSTSPTPSPTKHHSPLPSTLLAQPRTTTIKPTSTPSRPHTAPPRQAAPTALPSNLPLPKTSALDPLLTQVLEEKSKSLGVLASLLGSGEGDGERMRRDEWKGFEESDDDDEEGGYEVLRLRGGAGSDEEEESSSEEFESDSDSDSDSTTSEADSSDSESSSGSSSDAEDDAEDSASKPKPKATLKDMFAPRADDQPTFSLLQNLDIELDEDLDIPLPLPATTQTETEIDLLPPETKQELFDPSPLIPLFFPVGPGVPQSITDERHARNGMKDDYSGKRVNVELDVEEVEERVSWGGRGDQGWKRGLVSRGTGGEGKGLTPFCRVETDDQMKEIWERERTALTREYKRRHREAVKQRRRRGGPGDDE